MTASSGAAASPRGANKPKRSRAKKSSVPQTPGHARIIAIANQKGGVGKSTTAVSLGAALADLGFRVLVLDLDPQGNASTGMGIRHEAREVTVYEVIVAEAALDDAIIPTAVERLHAVPSTIDLAGAEIELVSQFSREGRLKRALDPVRDGRYDFVLLDCPPSLGLLTVNALTAAEELIVPIQCEYYALEGLGQLLRNVGLVQQNINPDLRLAGIVMTMFDPRTKLSEQVVAEVRRFFGDLVYDVIIPRTVRLSEAPGFGQPITLYDPKSKGAEAYRALAREVAATPAPERPIPAMDEIPAVVIPSPSGAGGTAEPAHPIEEPADVPTVSEIEEQVSSASEPATSDSDEEEREDQAVATDVTEAIEDASEGIEEEDSGAASAATREDLWEEPDTTSERRVRPVVMPSDQPAPRVVVIDENQASPDAFGQPPSLGSPDVTGAEIGATLHDDEPEAGKRRWRLFRKGGGE